MLLNSGLYNNKILSLEDFLKILFKENMKNTAKALILKTG